MLKKVGIEAERWAAIDGRLMEFYRDVWIPNRNKYLLIHHAGALACALSHIEIIKDAMSKGYDKICVFEDDIYLHKDFSLENLPDADLVYLGATQFDWDGTEASPYYKARKSLGTFAMVIKSTLFQPILDGWEKSRTTIDNMLAEKIQPKYNCVVMFPNIVACDVGTSDIRKPWDVKKHCQNVKWVKEDYSLPPRENWLDYVTFGITHFDRPDHLARCIESIENMWPTAKIIVADNSKLERPKTHVKVLELEPDCGVSKCRNELMKAIDTDYLMLCEEDFIFNAESKINLMFDMLEGNQEYGVIGGSIYIKNELTHSFTSLREVDGHVQQYQSIGQMNKTGELSWKACDKPFDFCLIRKGCGKWNEDIKIGGDHLWYFWNLKKEGEWKVAATADVRVIHDTSNRSQHYIQHRGRNFNKGFNADFSFVGVNASKPNIVVLGVGHTGTTILTQMINKLGWSLADADEKFAESVSVRRLNELIIKGENVREQQKECLAALPQPWVIKDPRMVATLDRWLPMLQSYNPLLVGITRDIEEVKKSYERRNERLVTHSGHTVDECFKVFEQQYNSWPWNKIIVKYEDLAAIIKMWDR